MMKRKESLSTEELTEMGFRKVPTSISRVSCQAPLSWCSHCDLCEHGSHYELLEQKTDKSRRMDLKRTNRISLLCLFLSLCCLLLLSGYFCPSLGTPGIVFIAVLLLIFCVVGVFYSAKGIILTTKL